MLAVISPAKNLDYESPSTTEKYTQPELFEHSAELVDICKNLTPADLSNLMGISDKLAGLNAARFTSWKPNFDLSNSKQAVLAFNGDVYTGLEASTLSAAQLDFCQQHLRILSGLYGLLKPLDLMMPYRLEMGTKLKNNRGTNLYQFWQGIVTPLLNKALLEQGDDVLVNLASNEYFKVVEKKLLNARVITPSFKDWKNGQYKMISFFAKKARGLMVRYMIDQQITEPEQLKNFNYAGYQFNEALSKGDNWVFTRRQD